MKVSEVPDRQESNAPVDSEQRAVILQQSQFVERQIQDIQKKFPKLGGWDPHRGHRRH